MQLTRRIIAGAKLQAEVAAASSDTSLLDQLDMQAKKLGYRSWIRLINKFKERQK